MRIDIREAGAAGSGSQTETAVIQQAIDRCGQTGGGVVYFPPGKYLSGGLHLRSHVQLYLESGAVLLASTHLQDFVNINRETDGGRKPSAHLLSAEGVQDISIAGPGAIDGNAPGDYKRGDPNAVAPSYRIGVIHFSDCQNIRLREITIRNSDWWTVHLRHCDRVWIDSIAILNNVHRRNSDGIDPDGCRQVHISNCHIVAGDDCIVLKSCEGRSVEDIVVSNCTMETTATAIKLGTESRGDFRNIHVSNCVIRRSSGGIGFFLKDGATMERISFSHLSIEDREDDLSSSMSWPIFMDIERRDPDSKIGRIRDVSMSGLQIASRTGLLVQGMPESPIENLTLRDVNIRVTGDVDFTNRHKRVGGRRSTTDERDTLYARQPSYATIAHVHGLAVENLRVMLPEECGESRAALSLHQVCEGTIRGISATSKPIRMEACQGIDATN